MYGGGQLLGANAGGAGSKDTRVADIAERDTWIGRAGDGQKFFVVDATADPNVNDPSKPWARYQYNKDSQTFTKIGEEESIDLSLYATLDPDAVTIQAIGDIPAGTRFGDIIGREIPSLILDMLFKTQHYQYTAPVTNLNNVAATVEVGEIFNVNLVASLTQNDGGPANRVILKKKGLSVQDTLTPTLDFTYDDLNVVLNDGGQVQYQSTIHYDQGPEQTDTSGKGIVSPGRIEAGFDDSPVYSINARRRFYAQMSVVKPIDSAGVKALTTFQWDNDYTLNIPIANGDTSVTIVTPANRTIESIIEQADLGLNNNVTTQVLATEEIINVEGGSPGYTQGFRMYHFAPPASHSSGTYVITFKNV